MRIRFWGTRGSIPVTAGAENIRAKIKRALRAADGKRFANETQLDKFIDNKLDFPTRHGFGGDSACIQIEGGPDYLLCDMGSGLRRFGRQVMQQPGPHLPRMYHFLMSHVHWDHIQGFPFFPPAYVPGNTIHIYSCLDTGMLAAALQQQHASPFFPVDWNELGADIIFNQLQPDRWHDINGFRIKGMLQSHHGDSYSYRFEKDDKCLVYATDAEHKQARERETGAVIAFFEDADLVIFDAMYSLAEMVTVREDWGHSSNIVGVDLCLRANVKHYCMFHHDPSYNDETLYKILLETRRYGEIVSDGRNLKISAAYDDMVVDI
ncbi:MAG: Metal-dependent hydrolases of the beta-lactamase superfamily I [Olavius algarvensis Delta 4 endosymbiont]|nr:MAG: Metal-dependent hydrolases of the beta-lactamase superfamily I [Olavius algarvensis Delta 4 endosymbiont]